MPRPRKLVISKLFSDKDAAKLEGTWINNSHIKYPIINYNCDVYYKDDNGENILLLKFRKKCFKNNQLRIGWKSFKDLAYEYTEFFPIHRVIWLTPPTIYPTPPIF